MKSCVLREKGGIVSAICASGILIDSMLSTYVSRLSCDRPVGFGRSTSTSEESFDLKNVQRLIRERKKGIGNLEMMGYLLLPLHSIGAVENRVVFQVEVQSIHCTVEK
jgi:hypothetical protein